MCRLTLSGFIRPIAVAGCLALVAGCGDADPSGPSPDEPMLEGGDVVVFADLDIFGRRFAGDSVGNQTLFGNLVGFTNSRPRSAGQTVLFYTGASSKCPDECGTEDAEYVDALGAKLTADGYTVVNETGSLASIPADAKVVFLWLPRAALPAADVNGLKQFASEGGRVVVVGEEHDYAPEVTPVVAQLLLDLGTPIGYQGAQLACGSGNQLVSPESTHPVVSGIAEIAIYCVSALTVGPNATVLVREPGGYAVGAVATIDPTPLP